MVLIVFLLDYYEAVVGLTSTLFLNLCMFSLFAPVFLAMMKSSILNELSLERKLLESIGDLL